MTFLEELGNICLWLPYDSNVWTCVVVALCICAIAYVYSWKAKLQSWYDSNVYTYLVMNICGELHRLNAARKRKIFSCLLDKKKEGKKSLEILEIGVGSGLNYEFYPAGSHVRSVDPKRDEFDKHLVENAVKHDLFINRPVPCFAEDLNQHFSEESFDAVVCTYVLCSVSDVDKCLEEIKRVLKKGGVFIYLEHVADDESWFRWIMQYLFLPIFRTCADNCYLRSRTWEKISASGFRSVDQERFIVKGTWKHLEAHLAGVAFK